MDIDVTIGNDATMKGGVLSGLGRIDQYELVKELGGGGFGCVFLAKDTVAGVEVAVKGLPPEVKHNKEELENIRENFALVSRLHHPNIAAALVLHPAKEVAYANRDVMEKLRVFEGDTLMVMEYAPGMTLSSWRKQFPDKRVPAGIAVDVVRQIALALDYAHERKIIHRDIKPANVMIETLGDGGCAVRILDFGLAAEIRSSMGRVSREIRDMSGTRPYMAPEQWAGEKQGAATDQYALAVLCCELVSGEVPYQSAFESGDSVVMMANVIHRPVKLPADIPNRFQSALLRALSKKPVGRYPTCEAFVEALRHRAFPWHLFVIGLLALAVGAAGGWRLLRGKSQPEPAAVEPAAASAVREEVIPVLTNRPESVSQVAVTNRDEKGEQEKKRLAEENDRIRREAEQKQRREEETLRRQREAEALKLRQEAELKRKQEDEALKLRQEAELRRQREAELKRQEEAERRKQAEQQAARQREAERRAAEQKVRQELRRRLEKGSEFVPNPPATAAGTERRVALPNGGHMDFIWCPPGRFLMGSPEAEDKRNADEVQHVVTLTKGYWIGKTEVTRAQWKAVMGDAGFAWSSLWGGDGEFPIDGVNWQQCQNFCRRAGDGFRLPTEAEWEYACRAGTMTPFSFGSDLNGTAANCSGGAEPYGTHISGPNSFGSKKVASYQRNPWGIYDMHGNLFEWCADYYAGYVADDLTDPKGPETGAVRVVRGGCWNFAPKMCRSAFRSRKDPVAADAHTGFRVCCDRLP